MEIPALLVPFTKFVFDDSGNFLIVSRADTIQRLETCIEDSHAYTQRKSFYKPTNSTSLKKYWRQAYLWPEGALAQKNMKWNVSISSTV